MDGALGMGYGTTSASLLLIIGIMPAVTSASIHIAEIATTAASGISHFRFGNIDRHILLKLVIPGSVGAFIGAALLSKISGEFIKPYISFFLLLLGFYILFRFLFNYRQKKFKSDSTSFIFLAILGFIAGFFDSIGGGGWGPITTPVLLAKKEHQPNKVIGTVDTSEFAITLSASLGFLFFLGWNEIHWIWVSAFVIGGVIAAPIAAWFIKIIPSHLFGILIGGMIIFTNTYTLLSSIRFVPTFIITPILICLGILWVGAIIYQFRSN